MAGVVSVIVLSVTIMVVLLIKKTTLSPPMAPVKKCAHALMLGSSGEAMKYSSGQNVSDNVVPRSCKSTFSAALGSLDNVGMHG